jgi:ribose transport system ATP-binding protein
MRGIRKRFGATEALRGVSLEVRGGEVLALIGENGAGKSTLMKVLSGAHPADSGEMLLAGQTYAPRSPHDAHRAGVAMIYQELNLAADLSVEDNIMLGREAGRLGLLDRRAQRRKVRDALALLGHAELRPETPVRRLSVGAQQLVEIARALAHEARLVVFDEPTSSLARRDTEHLFAVIGRLRAAGLGVVYISHFLEEVRRVAQRYAVLRDGELVGTGQVADETDARIVALMVGRTVDELFPRVPHKPGETLLRLERLSGRHKPSDVTLEVRRGEIVGIAGLVGAGRTELLRCLFGLDAVRSGAVRVGQVNLAPRPAAAIRAGLGLVSEDRKTEGLAQTRSIADNVTYSRLAPYSRLGWLNLHRRRAAVADWMRRLQIKARSPDEDVARLSGGNQQKVALARVLHQRADVLLLDEPTRGIDVGTKALIYRLIGTLAAEGKGVLFVSSYLPELLAVCDRLAVMSRGRLRDVRPVAEWNEETVMAAAIGGEEATAGLTETTSSGSAG